MNITKAINTRTLLLASLVLNVLLLVAGAHFLKQLDNLYLYALRQPNYILVTSPRLEKANRVAAVTPAQTAASSGVSSPVAAR